MDTTLAAAKRTDNTGKGAARKLRRAGRIPAVVYGPDVGAQPVHVDPTELVNIFRATGNRNTVVQLDVDGEVMPVLVREVQRHPVSREILHVDFYRVSADRPVEVMVPVVGVGRAVGMALGGRLRLIRRELKVRCAYDRIPAGLEVDISEMNINDMVKASEIPVPEGAELLFDADFNVVTIYGKTVAQQEAEAAEAAALAEAAAADAADAAEAEAED